MLTDVLDARRLEVDSSLPRRELAGDRIFGEETGEKRRGDITTTVAIFLFLPRGEMGEMGEMICFPSGNRESLMIMESRGTEVRRWWLRRGSAGRREVNSMAKLFIYNLGFGLYIEIGGAAVCRDKPVGFSALS